MSKLSKKNREKVRDCLDMDEVSELKGAIDLIKWTLVDAMEMNPETAAEIESAWTLILENIQ